MIASNHIQYNTLRANSFPYFLSVSSCYNVPWWIGWVRHMRINKYIRQIWVTEDVNVLTLVSWRSVLSVRRVWCSHFLFSSRFDLKFVQMRSDSSILFILWIIKRKKRTWKGIACQLMWRTLSVIFSVKNKTEKLINSKCLQWFTRQCDAYTIHIHISRMYSDMNQKIFYGAGRICNTVFTFARLFCDLIPFLRLPKFALFFHSFFPL